MLTAKLSAVGRPRHAPEALVKLAADIDGEWPERCLSG